VKCRFHAVSDGGKLGKASELSHVAANRTPHFILNFYSMNHTAEQIYLMLKTYFTSVANLDPWSEVEPGEVERMVKDCRFAEVDNVLFLLTPAPENYQAFTIENGVLVPLHQDHRAEFCSTCSEQSPSAASHEPF
jgi:hypothetical protein